ncbi:MAG: aminopeptidase P family protein [Candidatus Eremiobacteraeota bacterium]|nr:aminopeptidase P family protein [Candidatus Eremiobacteraeota bacterium]
MTDILHKAGSHDTAPPPALLEFMVRDWAPHDAKVEHVPNAQTFAQRRRLLSQRFRGEVLVIATGHEKVRANDTMYRFRPGTDFYYLTGNTEPDCVLLLVPDENGHRDVLFVEPNPGRSDATFFTDRNKGELWTGPRLGVPESRDRYRVDQARPIAEFADALAKAGEYAKGTRDLEDPEFRAFLSEMRLIKDNVEIAELRKAMASTKRAFEDVVRALPTAHSERHVEGVFNLRARVEGNDVGYNTIAASGPNACILHWTKNTRQFKRNDLLLLDAGVEIETLYTADITRTVPISGRFSESQERVYALVLAAQEAGFAACLPGNDFMAPNRAAMQVLAQGLERLEILESAEDALKEEHQFYKRYSLHNVSHMLGLDVHDCAAARAETYKYGKLQPGMVLTVEPGLYFQTNDLTVPERYRGIGVRIEDDVLITKDGFEVLSRDIPRGVAEVERWMHQLWATPANRLS